DDHFAHQWGRLIAALGYQKESQEITALFLERFEAGEHISWQVVDASLLMANAQRARATQSKQELQHCLRVFEQFERLHKGLGEMAPFGDVHHDELRASALIEIGIIYKRLGQLDKTLSCLREAKTAAMLAQNPKVGAVATGNEAGVWLAKGDFAKALILYR